MRFQFDPHQSYQTGAISAVTGLFDGQPADADQLLTSLRIGSLQTTPLFDARETGQGTLDLGAG